ncbi:acetate kinase [Emergomyces africanus]|uniref:Probable acetate kinase n=1 Tax=Emergomyces africanus TaxID=1955775 RepID=A0A1B7P5T7_9EURO|nr:acetate kinase [Emergomyces africanus]
MSRAILSVNAGSSSVKVTIYRFEIPPVKLASAQVAGLTAPPCTFKNAQGVNREKNEEILEGISSPQEAFKYLLDHFVNDPDLKEVASKDDFAYICHRVVHGGDFETEAVITEDAYDYLQALKSLAPLHNTASLDIINICLREIPKAKTVAYFDSTFHQSMPDYVKVYPINPEKAKENLLRKYGFHGISYSFITRSVAEFFKQPIESTSIIALHLGSGASVCAIRNGKSIDTSMGLTPLAGLPGATRSGDIDPSLVFHYTSKAGNLSPESTKDMHISTAERILNKQSGWKSLTGTTDFSQIATETPLTDQHRLAFEIFIDRIVGFIGNYVVKLDGHVDALVFAGGIGEKSALLRKKVVERCRCLGFVIDQEVNGKGLGDEGIVVTDISQKLEGGQRREKRPRVLICQTDEEVCTREEYPVYLDPYLFPPAIPDFVMIAIDCLFLVLRVHDFTLNYHKITDELANSSKWRTTAPIQGPDVSNCFQVRKCNEMKYLSNKPRFYMLRSDAHELKFKDLFNFRVLDDKRLAL